MQWVMWEKFTFGIGWWRGVWMEDVGAGRADSSLMGTLSLCKDAAVLTHQNTVRKCRRLCQGPEDYYLLCQLPLCIDKPQVLMEVREEGNFSALWGFLLLDF